MPEGDVPDPREEDIVYEDRRISRPDASLPDWESPDTSYRPIPIVWFAGALIAQVVTQSLIVAVFGLWLNSPAIAVIAIGLIASFFVWDMTMKRGLSEAAAAWRVATFAVLSFFFSLTALTVLA